MNDHSATVLRKRQTLLDTRGCDRPGAAGQNRLPYSLDCSANTHIAAGRAPCSRMTPSLLCVLGL